MGKYSDQVITAEQAARELHMSASSVRQGMIHESFPINIGMAQRKDGNKNYEYRIYRKPLDELKKLWGIK